jgi:aldose 1-epimerase
MAATGRRPSSSIIDDPDARMSCSDDDDPTAGIVPAPFGCGRPRTEERVGGLTDRRFLLTAPSGISALVSTRGATLVSLVIPDRLGRFRDVVLGFDSPSEYADHAGIYFGCTVGRVANRIRGASFRIGGEVYRLAANDGPNHLHGGADRSLDKVDWAAVTSADSAGQSVSFSYVSADMEEGYPGRLEVSVKYRLTSKNDLRIEHQATTDRATPVNLTNHTYWNLAGDLRLTVLDHELQIDAHQYTPTDHQLIPTGIVESIEGTPLDFRTPRPIGSRIALLEATGARGYDHNYVLAKSRTDEEGLAFAARLRDPASGRQVAIWTTERCLQLYSGNFLPPVTGKLGVEYGHRSGVCLEAQGYPDAVNNPDFPSSVLAPGDTYRSTTVFHLGTDAEP